MQRKTAKQPLIAVDWRWQRKKEKVQFSTFLVIQPSFCSIYILSIQKTKKNLGGLFKYEKCLYPIGHIFSTVDISLNVKLILNFISFQKH